jgi:hypothetical protein
MPRVRVIHWKASEAGPLLDVCRAGGFDVEFDDIPGPDLARTIRHRQPDAVVIDLTRMPSHGREMGIAIRRTKFSRHIPIVFVGGEPDKVAGIREFLPDAAYTTLGRLCSRLKTILARPPANPIAPPSVMERYGDRSKAQKLGIRAGSTVAVMDPPRDYAAALGEMPEDVTMLENPDDAQPVTLWFVRDPEAFRMALRPMRMLAPKTRLWILWPKGAASGLTQHVVRELANEIGLVDYKICGINERWSAMVFALRKAAANK